MSRPMDARPAPFPARPRRRSARPTRRSRPSPTSRTCRRARCGGSAAASSTSCWPTRPTGIVATDDRCPHMSAPLSIGELDGCVVACPLHEGRFDLCTGETVQMPTTGGLDADGTLPPDLVAGRARRQGRPARQEGRGAPADPGPAAALLPAPHRRRPDRGRPAARPEPAQAGIAARRSVRPDELDDLVGVVGDVEQVQVASRRSAPRASSVLAHPVEQPGPVGAADQDDREVADLAGLDEGQRLEQLVERARSRRAGSRTPSAYLTNITLRAKK